MSKTNKTIKIFVYTLVFAALFVSLSALFAPPAHADMGPKPYVSVTFKNLPDEPCYGTLLSKREGFGPSHVWDGDEGSKYLYGSYTDEADKAAWQAFVDYADPDGYYFLQTLWRINENRELQWGYYPPDEFKILLYFPERGTYTASGFCESYAFHSFFEADVNDGTAQIKTRRSYDYAAEIISLIARIAATVLVELGVAWLFKLRKKYQMLTVLAANCATQSALNVALYVLAYFDGWFLLLFLYIPLELIVFFIEWIIYASVIVPRENGEAPLYVSAKPISSAYCALYSFCANAVSFALGVALSILLPGVF